MLGPRGTWPCLHAASQELVLMVLFHQAAVTSTEKRGTEVQFMETSPKTERPDPDTGQQSRKAAWRKSLQQNQAGERGINRAGERSTHAAGTPQAGHQTANGHGQKVWGWPSGERTGEFKAGPVREQLRRQD